jgi:hypothetical protein
MKKTLLGLLADIVCARNIVFLAMFSVGALCIIMSASNTTAYLQLTGMGQVIALMTGIALVIFSSTSATAAQLFIAQTGWAKIFAVPFIVVSVAVITFSIFSTLSLNYHKFVSSPAVQADIEEKINKKRSELIAALKTEDSQNVNQWAMENIDRLLDMSQQSGQSWNNSMRTIMEMTKNLSETEQQERDAVIKDFYVEILPRTFFGFMLSLGGLERKYLFDFFMIAIPAVFYDLIAPLAMTVVLFLMGFKTKKEIATVSASNEDAAITPPSPVKPKEDPLDIKDLTAYIESAMQDDYQILPDDAVPNVDAQKCVKLRKYLSSFIYKGNPLISGHDGQYVSIFDKANLIRFITLQNNVQRKEGEA